MNADLIKACILLLPLAALLGYAVWEHWQYKRNGRVWDLTTIREDTDETT
jgi:hypothetical protein